MPHSLESASDLNLRPRDSILKRQGDANKSSVIGIAATATVLVVAAISGLIFWYLRRRRIRRNGSKHDRAGSLDGGLNTLHDRASKTPLMRVENQSQAPEDRENLAPLYHEDDEVSVVAPTIPHRTMSASTFRSLPPSYAVAVRASPGPTSQVEDESDIASHGVHRSGSTTSRTGGLRTLTLVAAQQSSDAVHEDTEGRGRSRTRSPEEHSHTNVLSPNLQRPAGRPRASSRFHEEDLDI